MIEDEIEARVKARHNKTGEDDNENQENESDNVI